MSDEDKKYTGSFSVGDRVEVTAADEDESWIGEQGTVIKTYRQNGGIFAPERNVEVVVADTEDEDHLAETDSGRDKLLEDYEEGTGYFLTSDEYAFEPI